MQFSSVLLIAMGLAPAAIATPVEVSSGPSLDARDKVKLNQYATMADCQNDHNILYHAAPVSMKCYDLDDSTGAFFLNTAGYLASAGWFHKGCGNWVDVTYGGYTGKCYEKGDVRSIMVQ